MGEILVGTCSWTDPTLIESGTFYPPFAKAAESRLRYYASQFSIVEVDNTYYAMLAEKPSRLWVERTPDDFIFDVKAFRIFTQHPTQPSALPRDIRDELTPSLKEKKNLYHNNLPAEMVDELWNRFESALLPLDSTAKLGVVLLQFPPWFHAGSSQMDYILSCKERLQQYRLAVEFRNGSWLGENNRAGTLDFLRQNNLPFVCVDEPQGFKSSVPAVAEATSDIAIVRFHGRNSDAWDKPGTKASDQFNYYYDDSELGQWVTRVNRLASQASCVHALFNTNFQDQGIVNARKLSDLLGIQLTQTGQLPLGWSE